MQPYLWKILTASAVSLLTATIALYFLIPYLIRKAFLDIPNARSSHKKVTPRGGGIGIVLGILAGAGSAYLLGLPIPPLSFFAGFLLMAGISFLDDKKNLPAGLRFGVHLVAMALVMYATGGLKKLPFPPPLNFELGWIGYLISGIWIIAVINFFNFLDGIDGYAGSQALIAGLSIAFISWGNALSVIGLCIAFSSLGFLLYNWHPAKIFMGDVGSVSLGFAFATLPFYSPLPSSEPLIYSMALFLWFFLADGAFTLIKRILNKEKIWEAHRTHLYQRLHQTGWNPRKVVVFSMGMALVVAAFQLYCYRLGNAFTWWSLGLGFLLFSVFLLVVFQREKKI